MKKFALLFLLTTLAFTLNADAKLFKSKKNEAILDSTFKTRAKKDVLKDDEYKQKKTEFFNAEGYGNTYNCKVEQQKFCKVKDLDTGIYILCDRDVSRTQWASAEIYYKYGRCVKLN